MRAGEKRAPRILLRSSWQTVNIGDTAHIPGVLALLEKHLPDAEVRLWPSSVGNGVGEMLQRRFPKLRIVQGAEALKQAFAECDFLLHGSGPSLMAEKDVARWAKETGKPYGVYGITFALQGSTATTPAPSPPSALQTCSAASGRRCNGYGSSTILSETELGLLIVTLPRPPLGLSPVESGEKVVKLVVRSMRNVCPSLGAAKVTRS